MGTRCLTYVFDDSGYPIVCIYRQFDGYPGEGGHGEDLVRLLRPAAEEVPPEEEEEGIEEFNGAEELAALLVMELKSQSGAGNIYLYPPKWPPDNAYQNFEYFIALGFPDGKPLVCYRESFGDGEYGELVPLIGGDRAVTEIGAIISGADLGDVQGAAPPDPESPIALLEALKRAAQSVIDVTRVVGRRCAEDPSGQITSDLVYDIRAKLEEVKRLATWAEDGLRLIHLVTSQKPSLPSGCLDRYGKE